MKQTRLLKILAAGVAGGVALSTAFAQESTTTTTTAGSTGASSTTSTTTLNGTGTISTIDPTSDYIVFRGETATAAEPAKYYYSKTTTVVDPEGRTVAWSALRPDMPVTYSYVKEGDRMVVTKVTLTKPLTYYEKKETTTTTTTRP